MIGVAGKNSAGTIELFEQHDAHELMRPGRRTEGESKPGALAQAGSKAVGAADDEADARAVLGAPLAQQCRERRTVEIFAALVENDDKRSFGDDVGERDRLLDAPPLGVVRATLPDFDDFKIAQAKRPSGGFGAFAIPRGKLTLGTRFQTADRGDNEVG